MGRRTTFLPSATRTIVNAFSDGGSGGVSALSTVWAKPILSGALTATELATILSVTGQGWVDYLVVYANDGTTRTLRLQLIIDGVTAFDSTYTGIAGNTTGIIAVGAAPNDVPAQPVRFNSSFIVKISSSLSETDKATVEIAYKTE